MSRVIVNRTRKLTRSFDEKKLMKFWGIWKGYDTRAMKSAISELRRVGHMYERKRR